MTDIQVKRGHTDAVKAGDETYFKSKQCMLCKCYMYWVRGHRCATCNPTRTRRRDNRDEVAKQDNYKKTGISLAGRYVPEKRGEWPEMDGLEDTETGDHIGSRWIKTVAPIGIPGASSAASMADG